MAGFQASNLQLGRSKSTRFILLIFHSSRYVRFQKLNSDSGNDEDQRMFIFMCSRIDSAETLRESGCGGKCGARANVCGFGAHRPVVPRFPSIFSLCGWTRAARRLSKQAALSRARLPLVRSSNLPGSARWVETWHRWRRLPGRCRRNGAGTVAPALGLQLPAALGPVLSAN